MDLCEIWIWPINYALFQNGDISPCVVDAFTQGLLCVVHLSAIESFNADYDSNMEDILLTTLKLYCSVQVGYIVELDI